VAKQDQGYRRSTGTSYSGGGGRGRTMSTYLAQTKKNEVADLYIRTQTSGILDVLGLDASSDLAVSIKQMFKDDVAQDKPNKAEMGEGYIAIQETGRPGRAYREELTREYFAGISVDDPLKRDAVQTNLAPLVEAMYRNEEALGLIGQPRLDLILTDGEFESEKDSQAAAEWQRLRGPGVTSYVLDLCPGEIENPVELPHQFRVIPLQCLVDEYGAKDIDSDILRQSLIQIATEEVTKLQ
jgi:hypothetical protein